MQWSARQWSYSTVWKYSKPYELSGITHVTPFRKYGKHSTEPGTFRTVSQYLHQVVPCKSVLTVCSNRTQSNDICTYGRVSRVSLPRVRTYGLLNLRTIEYDQSQPIFRAPNHKSVMPASWRLGFIPHWPSYCHQGRNVSQSISYAKLMPARIHWEQPREAPVVKMPPTRPGDAATRFEMFLPARAFFRPPISLNFTTEKQGNMEHVTTKRQTRAFHHSVQYSPKDLQEFERHPVIMCYSTDLVTHALTLKSYQT